MVKKTLILILCLFVCLSSLAESQAEHSPYLERQEVKDYISYLSSKHDLEESMILELFSHASHQEKVIRIMNSQPEGTWTWSKYRKKIVEDKSRLESGKQFIETYKEELLKAEDLYGVPAEIIASIIGIETRYGKVTGNTLVLDSLMTLSFDYPRREKFFKVQLEEFLLLSFEENLDPLSVKGSIAGAMGYGQFMPDSYRKYAVDFDQDGTRDILNNPIDAIGSVANFLSKKGNWKPNTPIAVKAKKIKEDVKFRSSFKPYLTSINLEQIGLKPLEDVVGNLKFVPVELSLEERKEYWLGFDNYHSLSRYNRSKFYIMAVFEFSKDLSQFF